LQFRGAEIEKAEQDQGQQQLREGGCESEPPRRYWIRNKKQQTGRY
jgi:hypothetical protein